MFAGVEGGGTKTIVTILSSEGKVVGQAVGPHSNHWRIGSKAAVERIVGTIKEAKRDGGLPDDLVLDAVGMCLSGVDTVNCQKLIEDEISIHSDVARKFFVWNDSVGSACTMSSDGGVVLIAGTGSIGVLVLPDGAVERVGGYGHMLGDEGGAYWIVHRAIKAVIDHRDGVIPQPHPVTRVQQMVFDYFKIEDNGGFLTHFYTNFDKTHIAWFCVELAKAAEEGDLLCKRLFYDAGYVQARFAMAILKKRLSTDPPNILCIGSVWKSWNLLLEGFLEGMKPKYEDDPHLSEFSLAQLKVDGSVGAAALSAKMVGQILHINYEDNFDVFYHHDK